MNALDRPAVERTQAGDDAGIRPLELQVLEGEQQGASTRLPPNCAITLSDELESDIVLRGPTMAGNRLSITARGAGLDVRVRQGEAEVNGQPLRAGGETARLEVGQTLTVGGIRLGIACLPAPGQTLANGAQEPAPLADPDPLPPLAPSAPHRWPRRLALGGGALAAVSLCVLAFAYTLTPASPTAEQQARRAEAVLRGAGLQRLSVRATGTGEVKVDGYLETQAQRAQAERLLEGEQIPAQWQVWVNEQVVSAVQDVYRVNGVAARVEAVGPGAVRVHTSVADPLSLDPILSIARRDVPGLASTEVRNELRREPRQMPSIDDPGKRVSSIVSGDPPYVVTVDGTRYFEGALLPTGQRIAGIEEHQVVLELDGVRTPLVF